MRAMNEIADTLPIRRTLHHTPPIRVAQYAIGAPYFITICADRAHYGIPAADAGRIGPLIDPTVAHATLEAIEHRRAAGKMAPFIALIMPDHVHIIAAFPPSHSMQLAIRGIKRFIAVQHGIVWQKGYFDHRLRNDRELAEKWRYTQNNPVAKGLCANAEDWPFCKIWQR